MLLPKWSDNTPEAQQRRSDNAKRREQHYRERARHSDWVTIGEFCRITSRARSTVDRWRKRRPMGFPMEYGSTGRPMFKRAEVLAWLESQPLY